MSTKSTVGRRFTKRVVTTHKTPDGDVSLEEIDHDGYLNADALRRHRSASIDALESAKIPAREILSEHPGGSALRDYVLNHPGGHDPDSMEGIAAQICELCIRIEALPALGAPASILMNDAFRLGQLVVLAKAYGIDGDQRREAARVPRRKKPLRAKIVEAMRVHRGDDRSLCATLAAMVKNRHDGLSLTFLRDEDKYLASDDNTEGSEKKYGMKALEGMFTDAGKLRRR